VKLRVFIPAADRLDATHRIAWALFDARDNFLRRDATPLADVPRADEVELALPASRVLFARLRLPRVNAATIRELLPFAVEDRLLADPSHIHAVAGTTNSRGETLVAVVDREWLDTVVRALSGAGLHARHAWCESALLAGGQGDWHAVLGSEHGFLVDDDGVAVAFDRSPAGDMPLALRVAIDEAGARDSRPTSVHVHVDGAAPLPDLARWSEQVGLPFSAGSPWSEIAAAALPRQAIDLLRDTPGALSEGRAAGLVPRAALVLLALIAALQFTFTALDAWRLTARRDALAAKQEAVFRAAFPDAKVVVDPELQMARNLAELKRSRGLAAEDDFLVQATRAARQFPAGGARSLGYANGRLEVRRGEALAEAKR
jgi:general secretion pathway protein L